MRPKERTLQMVFNPTKITMAVPKYNADKIIGVFSGSITVAAPTVVNQVVYAEDVQTTGFGNTCLTQLIYSIDNGVTWNDENTAIPYLPVSGFPVFQVIDVSSFSRTNQVGVALNNWYNNVTSSSTAYTVLYKVFCLSKSDQGATIPLPNNYSLYYTSKDNYLKIFDASKTATSVPATPSTATVTITHGLGYAPTSRGFLEYSNGEIWPASINQYNGTNFTGPSHNPVSTSIQPDTVNVNYVMGSSSLTQAINLYSVVYLDA